MIFIGQPHIMAQLDFLLPTLYENDVGENFLLCAASGQGKTYMAQLICNYLAGEDYQTSLGKLNDFDSSYRVHFIDEAHMVPVREFEAFYPIMDSRRYVIVLATNEFSMLPEPVINRCNNSGFVFAPYSDSELRDIVAMNTDVQYDESHIKYIIRSGGRNPRVILGLVRNLEVYFQYYPFPSTMKEFKSQLKDVFGIVDGIEPIAGSYLEALKSVGGTASIATMAGLLKINAETLKARVEPLLLANNLIRINSKGRSLW